MNFWDDTFEPMEAWCDEHYLSARLTSGVIVRVPLWWYPRLQNATLAQRNQIELSYSGLHWNGLDDDVKIEGMIMGWKAKDAVEPVMNAAE